MKTTKVLIGILGALVLVSCTATSPSATTPQGEGFAVYLTANDTPVSQMEALSYVELANTPMISEADIVSYHWDTHEIELTEQGMERINSLQVPTNGKSFVVCVDKQSIYWGAFWTPISSQSFDGITIWTLFASDDRTITIRKGYPGSSFFQGDDPRSDPGILKALEQSGKIASIPTSE